MQQLAPRCSGAPVRHFRRATGFGLVIAADECGQQVRSARGKVVTRPVQVGRHRGDPRQTVLTPDRLYLKDAGNLGDRVCVVRRLKRPGEKRALRDRLGGELRVNAGGAKKQQPRYPGGYSSVEQVDLDLQVL